MIEDKIGTKPYLGIEIDYDKEKTFDKFSLDTLKDRYFWEGETHAQEAFARASSSEQHSKARQILNWLKDFTTTLPLGGSCLALLYLVTGEPLVGFLSVVSLIMFLTVGVVYLLTMMRIYGWQVQVEASVDIGAILGAMVFQLLMAVVLLVLFLSSM